MLHFFISPYAFSLNLRSCPSPPHTPSVILSNPINWLLLRTRSWWSSKTTWRWSKQNCGGKRRPSLRRRRLGVPSCPPPASLSPPHQAPAKRGAAWPPPRVKQRTGFRKNAPFSSLCSPHVNTTPAALKATLPRTHGSCGLVSRLLLPALSSPHAPSGGGTELFRAPQSFLYAKPKS